MKIRRQFEVRDGEWLVPERVGRIRFVSPPFLARIRALPRHRARSLAYASWWMLLVFWLLMRWIVAYEMTTGIFSASRGIPIDLGAQFISEAQVTDLLRGEPVRGIDGIITVDPSWAEIAALEELRSAEGGASGAVARFCDFQAPDLPRRRLIVVIRPATGAGFQDLITSLDEIRSGVEGRPACDVLPIVVTDLPAPEFRPPAPDLRNVV